MNIFFLDRDPKIAAQYHCDTHVVKMILETAQLLSTAHHEMGSPLAEHCYKSTHVNHPCAIWVRQSIHNYRWTYDLFRWLTTEYWKRRGKIHASWKKLGLILDTIPDLPDLPFRDPPQCMPEVYKKDDTVEAYRQYYRLGKRDIVAYKWINNTPEWMS